MRGRAELIDVSQASDARIYSFLLGGSDHYGADREAVRCLLDVVPNARQLARINRQFLVKAVRYLAGACDIGQFLDHGAGLPMPRNNVHQVARRANPAARVVYIDHDPVVLAHARMMVDDAHTLILDADMLDTGHILATSRQAGFLKRDAAVGALFLCALHCIADERNPWQRVTDLMDQLPSGSCLVLSHLVSDDAALREEASRLMRRLTGRQWARVRSRAEVERFFDGLEPVGGPIGDVARWRPGTDLKLPLPEAAWIIYGGIARKP
ncbi:SAM-dependent methyltransferase [Streptomyces sp. NPDC001401]|uniref:SAM-dependent methyltransferase n=1 Tax=Streptomyces sp. NPDC001401 TaxID=3364570 RepID=UPI00369DF144